MPTSGAGETGCAPCPFDVAAARAADRFRVAGRTAWYFARGKLRGDPVYRSFLCDGLAGSGGTLLDVGCGQGLLLALVAEAARMTERDAELAKATKPTAFTGIIGVEMRPRIAAIARGALAGDATILEGDALRVDLPEADTIAVFDVLHLMEFDRQEQLIGRLGRRLRPGGVMLVREAAAGRSWRFSTVKAGNRLKALANGRLRQPLRFRTSDEWRDLFERHGFDVGSKPMGRGTPFANVLFRLTQPATTTPRRPPGASG